MHWNMIAQLKDQLKDTEKRAKEVRDTERDAIRQGEAAMQTIADMAKEVGSPLGVIRSRMRAAAVPLDTSQLHGACEYGLAQRGTARRVARPSILDLFISAMVALYAVGVELQSPGLPRSGYPGLGTTENLPRRGYTGLRPNCATPPG